MEQNENLAILSDVVDKKNVKRVVEVAKTGKLELTEEEKIKVQYKTTEIGLRVAAHAVCGNDVKDERVVTARDVINVASGIRHIRHPHRLIVGGASVGIKGLIKLASKKRDKDL